MRLYRAVSLVAGLAALVTVLHAGAPTQPREFSVTGAFTDQQGVYKAVLTWIGSEWENPANRPTGYRIYRATGVTEDVSRYSVVATVSDTGNVRFSYTDMPLQAGTYSYFLIAFNSDGESPRTPIRTVTVPPNSDDLLQFVTTPPNTGRVGVEYVYEARAVTPLQNVTIHYQLVSGPDGMTINSTTGVVRWTPRAAGRYEATIRAYIEVGGAVVSAQQHWVIEVEGELEACAVVTGVVRDTAGNLVSSGVVVAYRAVARDNAWAWIAAGKALVGDRGAFTLRLPAGRYKFVTEGESYFAMWYQNSRTAEGATVVALECDTTIEVNFTVIPRPVEQKFVVSGRVTAQATGSGVAARVQFTAIIDRRNDRGQHDWEFGPTFTAETNADGYYEIRLPNRYTYIARAIPRSDDYLPIYFDGVTNANEATRITLTGNRDGVNFALPSRPQARGGFGGRIIDSAGTGIPGYAIACRIIRSDNDRRERIRRFRTVETDSLGYYQFTNLEAGVYVVLGVPRSRDYVPGYCVLGDYATLRWRNATRIEVGDAMLTVQYDIKLRARTGERGIIRIEGSVRTSGGVTQRGPAEQADSPVSGVLVAWQTSSGVSDYDFTDDNGSYVLTEASPTSGELIADHPDYEPYSAPMTIPPTVSAVNQDAQLTPAQISTVTDESALLSVSPNPASDYVRIELGDAAARVEIVSLLGTVLAAVETSTPVVQLSTDSLASGMYLLRITTTAGVRTVPLAIVR